MQIKYRDILTLNDDNEYVVVGITKYEDIDYVYLVDINNNTNIKFAELKDNGVLSIINPGEKELIEKLVPLFYKVLKNSIKSES